ncbi:MAG: hypothetical protein M3Q58_11340 [Bacteroidota bacterium]|nr:hypothetical protein [Bacteroidota bacterium]
MEPKYYIPTKSTSLAHYFGKACILPSVYYSNKQIDLQDSFKNFILVTKILGVKDADCCLEIVLTQSELENDLIKISQDFYLIQKPIPISRVKQIIFSSKEGMQTTVTNVNMSTAFIPDNLTRVEKNFENVVVDKIELPKNIEILDWSNKIKEFDRYLGAFAIMRLAGEDYMNYSEYYFSTLSFFNNVIKRELELANQKIDNRFFDAFIGENNFKKLLPIITKDVNENDLDSIAKEEKQSINRDKITRIIDLKNLEKATLIVAVLNTFGVGEEAKKKKIDGLIFSNFKSEIKSDKSEAVAFCYGLNKGYSIFPNKYKLSNNEKIVKFKLNNQVDYYTIESLFQYVFNREKLAEFFYLDSWCPKLEQKDKIVRKTDYIVLDTVVIGKKKPKVLSQEYLENLLLCFFQKESSGFFKGLFEKIREKIYTDAFDELSEELIIKEDEIKKLKVESEKVKNRLENEKDKLIHADNKSKSESYNLTEKIAGSKGTAEDPLIIIQKFDKKQIIEQVLLYKNKNKATLEKVAIEKGITIPKGIKVDELIILLLNASNNSNASKIEFPE